MTDSMESCLDGYYREFKNRLYSLLDMFYGLTTFPRFSICFVIGLSIAISLNRISILPVI